MAQHIHNNHKSTRRLMNRSTTGAKKNRSTAILSQKNSTGSRLQFIQSLTSSLPNTEVDLRKQSRRVNKSSTNNLKTRILGRNCN